MQTSVDVAWTPDTYIIGNLPTIGFRVYLNDLSGNPPYLVFDTT